MSAEDDHRTHFETLQNNNDGKSSNSQEEKEDFVVGIMSVLKNIQQQLDTLQSEVSMLKRKVDSEK